VLLDECLSAAAYVPRYLITSKTIVKIDNEMPGACQEKKGNTIYYLDWSEV
jgi:hypothetical protein